MNMSRVGSPRGHVLDLEAPRGQYDISFALALRLKSLALVSRLKSLASALMVKYLALALASEPVLACIIVNSLHL